MPMRLKVGLTRKVGQPDFGSLGANCDVELELDGALLFQDPDGLQGKIRAVYEACEQAIREELARQSRQEPEIPSPQNGSSNGHQDLPGISPAQEGPPSGSTTNGARQRRATTSQIRALHAIARRQGFALTDVVQDRFQRVNVEELSVAQASQLIDELNGAPIGTG